MSSPPLLSPGLFHASGFGYRTWSSPSLGESFSGSSLATRFRALAPQSCFGAFAVAVGGGGGGGAAAGGAQFFSQSLVVVVVVVSNPRFAVAFGGGAVARASAAFGAAAFAAAIAVVFIIARTLARLPSHSSMTLRSTARSSALPVAQLLSSSDLSSANFSSASAYFPASFADC